MNSSNMLYRDGFFRIALIGGASVVALASSAFAGEPADFDIEAGELQRALNSYIEQSGEQLFYRIDEVRGVRTKGVEGRYDADEALQILLNGAGFDVRRDPSGAAVVVKASLSQGASVGGNSAVRLAQRRQAAPAVNTETRPGDEDAEKRDEIIVTGTNIRGIAPESSPVRTYTREDIQITGAATAQDFIQTLPQNFGGGSNTDFISLPNDDAAGQNFGDGASVNLRGLGSGSTLVLLNGRRMAPSSNLGDFVDISLIPASAIERVDVLTDGASSIYGADAVAGVINFVLRDDYDGAEASLRYGSVTQGNMDEFRANLTGGKSWDTGNVLLAYEFLSQTNLSAEDRAFSRNVVLPNDLLPSQRRHSALMSASQQITPDFEASADASFSTRETVRDVTTGVVDNFQRPVATTDNLNVSLGGSWRVADDWFFDFSGTYSKVDLRRVNDTPVVQQDFQIDSAIWVGDALASGPVFSLPGGEVKLAFGGHVRSETFSSFSGTTEAVLREADRDVYALFGEAFIPIIGPDNARPGVQRLELNVSGRYSDFSDFGATANPKIGVLWSPVDGLRLRGSYSTSFNPPALGRVGDALGSALAYPTALSGVLFGVPVPDDSPFANTAGLFLTGTSEQLDAETSRAFSAGLDFSKDVGRNRFEFSATYFDIEFEDRLGATPIPDGRNRFEAPSIALETPGAFPEGAVILDPSPAQINDVLDFIDLDLVQIGGADPFDASFINLTSIIRNLSLSIVRGIDVEAGYTFDSDHGVYTLGVSGTFINDFQRQAAVTTPLIEQVNTQFNPVDLRLRARAGYARNGFSGVVFVNYTDSYRTDNTPGAVPIEAWTTVDVTLTYDLQNRLDNTFLNNTLFRLSVINLFDQNPPSTPLATSSGIAGFDPTNSSPLNRFVSFEATKRF